MKTDKEKINFNLIKKKIMKQSIKLKKENNELRIRIISEIMMLVKKHLFDLEMAVEFPSPIFYGSGVDEQDNAPEVEEVTDSGLAIVYYQGSEIERVRLETMETDKLLEILEGLELSLEDAIKFKEGK
jgi:hypothetical protein